jgi:hypothetical protein
MFGHNICHSILEGFGTNQTARISYIKRRNNPSEFLLRDNEKLNKEFSRIYAVAKGKNFGADIWTYLNEFDGERVLEPEKAIQDDAGNTYANKYKNILILARWIYRGGHLRQRL